MKIKTYTGANQRLSSRRTDFSPSLKFKKKSRANQTYFADIITWTKIASSVAANMNSTTGCPFLQEKHQLQIKHMQELTIIKVDSWLIHHIGYNFPFKMPEEYLQRLAYIKETNNAINNTQTRISTQCFLKKRIPGTGTAYDLAKQKKRYSCYKCHTQKILARNCSFSDL